MINVNAYKEYNKKVVLDVRDVAFDEGRIYAVIGSNGSGKSTLLKCISSTIKYTGKTDSDGMKLSSVGYLPQKNFAFDMSVKNNMLLNRQTGSRKNAVADALVMLKKFDLVKYLHKNASRLSGGETQKLAVCRLFMGDYKLVLLDEPTAFLDYPSKVETMLLLARLSHDTGKTIFMSTHDLELALQTADTLWLMAGDGKVAAGTPRGLADSGALSAFVERSGIVFDKATLRITVDAGAIR